MSVRSLPMAAALAVGVLVPAVAAAEAPPDGVLTLSATATAEVPRDFVTLVLSTTRDGADAAAVQAQLRQALDAALSQARRVAQPGQVDVRTGAFSLSPRYGTPTPKGHAGIVGWQGTAELIVEGRDAAAIAQLPGRIDTMTVGRVAYGLSRELRQQSEGDLAAQAIASFRAKAGEYARQFGYAGFTVREVNVSTTEPDGPVRFLEARVAAAPAAMSSPAALPIDAGKGALTVSVNGSVQMTK